jgi:hypothetical protein
MSNKMVNFVGHFLLAEITYQHWSYPGGDKATAGQL